MDGTMLPDLNDIGNKQTRSTEETYDQTQKLMNYAATYPDAFVRLYASDMILRISTDASYLVLSKVRSQLVGYIYMGNTTKCKALNSVILIVCKTIKHDASSVAEAETGATFHNAHTSVPI